MRLDRTNNMKGGPVHQIERTNETTESRRMPPSRRIERTTYRFHLGSFFFLSECNKGKSLKTLKRPHYRESPNTRVMLARKSPPQKKRKNRRNLLLWMVFLFCLLVLFFFLLCWMRKVQNGTMPGTQGASTRRGPKFCLRADSSLGSSSCCDPWPLPRRRRHLRR